MKKTAVLIALVVLLFGAFALCASAETVDSGTCGNNLTWTLDDEGTLTISGTGDMISHPWIEEYKDQIETVRIEYGVTNVVTSAFSSCTGLTSITIPESVTNIDHYAFSGCSGLTGITIPGNVTSIGNDAFKGCSGLEEITVAYGNITFYALNNCLIKGSSGTLILGCKNSVIPADGRVKVIGDSAFYNCTELTSITIPDGVTSICDEAFCECWKLASVTLPDSVTSIGQNAFYNTLWYRRQPEGLVYAGKVAYNYKGTMPENTAITLNGDTVGIADLAFFYGEGLTDITIPNGVANIGNYAFSGCTGLTSITIPDSVTRIGYQAFSRCKGLSDVTIGNSVTSIGDYAFSNCTELKSVTIPNSVTSIGDWAFYDCTGLTSVIMGTSVTSIGVEVFRDCTGLTSVIIGNGVTSIGEKMFEGCTGLTSITIPNSVTSIDSWAFYGCTGLTSVIIGNSITNIGNSAFSGCTGLTNVSIPNSVTSIGDWAFYDCTGLTSVMMGNSVTSIGRSAFDGCTRLKTISIPDSVTFIDYYAFHNCRELANIKIPGNVTTIYSHVFEGCEGLTRVTIPDSVTLVGICPFYGCINLKYVFYSGTETAWNAIIFSEENSPLFDAAIHYSSKGDHAWDNGTVTTPANCKQTGVKAYTCTCPGCDARKTESIPKTDHSYKNVITKATFTADGKITPTCTICGETKPATKIAKASKIALSKTKFVYNGKIQKPTLTVKDSAGKAIDSKYYTVKWSNSSSKAVGSYTVTVTFKGNYSGTKTLTYTIAPKAVTGVKNASPATKSIKLSWTKATGAKYYEVYGSTDGKTFKKITTVSTNSAKITKVNGKALAAGKTYYFKVRALDAAKKCVGAYSSVLKTGTLTAAPKITKLTSAKSKTATVTWGKVTGAKKYVVYKSTDGKKWTKVASTAKTAYTLTKLTGGKPIYVKVLAVNAYSAKSAYSAAKSVTVKK